MSASQCDRVYDVLKDGRPHTIEEIHDRAGTMRLNSRVADLRRRGLNIVHFTSPGRDERGRPRPIHNYRLILDEEADSPRPGVASSSSDQAGVDDQVLTGAAVKRPLGAVLGDPVRPLSLDSDDEQLSLIDIPPARPREIYA